METEAGWEQLIQQQAGLLRRIGKSTAANVAALEIRNQAKSLVQLYFRQVRAGLEELGLNDFDSLDKQFQSLLVLANRVTRRSHYLRLLRGIQQSLEYLKAQRERAIGEMANRVAGLSSAVSDQERRILATLETLVPS